MPYSDPEQQKAAMRAWNERRREETTAIILAAKADGCPRCGENDPACLDFHHTGDEEKSFSVSHRSWRNPAVLQAEIAKCVVLCANCHRKLHAGRFQL